MNSGTSKSENRFLVETIGRFLIAGSIGAATNVGILFVLTEYTGLYYLISAGISFIVACGISFSLQKFWTFQDHSVESIHAQAVAFFVISTANLFLNIVLLYILVEKIHIWYIFAQVIVSACIAVSSFLLYRHVIFSEGK